MERSSSLRDADREGDSTALGTPGWLRAVVIAWLALLGVAAIPRGVPVVGTLGRGAASALERVGVVPGIPLFGGSGVHWRAQHRCLTVHGLLPGGERELLHRTDCLPEGFSFMQDPFERLIQLNSRFVVERLLWDRSSTPPGQIAPIVRFFTALGDYFCHSPLAGSGTYTALELVRDTPARSYTTGATRTHRVECRIECLPDRVSVPRCTDRMLPK